MEFFIRQGSSDPILKLRLLDDGKNDKTSFNGKLNKKHNSSVADSEDNG